MHATISPGTILGGRYCIGDAAASVRARRVHRGASPVGLLGHDESMRQRALAKRPQDRFASAADMYHPPPAPTIALGPAPKPVERSIARWAIAILVAASAILLAGVIIMALRR